jgi:hypothetical protein
LGWPYGLSSPSRKRPVPSQRCVQVNPTIFKQADDVLARKRPFGDPCAEHTEQDPTAARHYGGHTKPCTIHQKNPSDNQGRSSKKPCRQPELRSSQP